MVHASTAAKGCAALISCGCLIGGIVLLEISTEQVHEHKAVKYAEVVDAWSSHRHEFKQLDISGSFSQDAKVKKPVTFLAEKLDDRATIEHGEDLPDYEPLAYRLRSPPSGFLPLVKFNEIEWQESNNEHHGVRLRLTLNIGASRLSTGVIPLVRAVASRSHQGLYDHCRQRRGTPAGGKCWTYSRLSRLCLQIAKVDGRWSWATRVPGQKDSYGCAYVHGNWTTSVYKDLDLVPIDPTGQQSDQGIHQVVMQSVVFDDLEIIIRSAYDPHLKALEVTDGTLDFGMTADEERTLAIVLFVLFVMLGVPPAVGICLWWRKRRSKRRPRYPIPARRQQRKPDPEMVGMKYAVGYDDGADS